MKQTTLIVLLCLSLLSSALIGVPTLMYATNLLSVGPEGVDAHLHGVEWTPHGVQDGGLNLVSEARPSDFIGWDGDRYVDYGNFRQLSWKRPDPYNPDVQLDKCTSVPYSNSVGGWATRVDESLVLSVRTRQAEVHEVNTRGDPLGTRSPTEIVWYQWESKTREETVGDTTEIEWTRYEAFVVPVDYVVEVSVRALTDGTWGSFEDLHLWYVMDTVRWHNAFAEPYGSLESGSPAPDEAELKTYNYRGAFPIWAWVDTWDPMVYEDEKGASLDLPSEIPDEMQDYLQISPSLGGSRLTLYHEPNWQYVDMYAKDIVKDDTKLGNALQSEIGYFPDPRFAETVFTPISLTKFGAFYKSEGWWIWNEETWVYPTAYLRVRALYVIWGQWIYLWTHEEAEKQGYEWQNRTSVIYHKSSAWNQFWGGFGSALSKLLTNPFFWLWFLIIGGVIFIVLLIFIGGAPMLMLIGGWLKHKLT